MKIIGTICATISRPASSKAEQSYYVDIYDVSQTLCRVKISAQSYQRLAKQLGQPAEISVSARAFNSQLYFTELEV